MLVEKEFLLSTIFSLSDQHLWSDCFLLLIHMFGQTTRKLVKIALLILHQTSLRIYKSYNHERLSFKMKRINQKYVSYKRGGGFFTFLM